MFHSMSLPPTICTSNYMYKIAQQTARLLVSLQNPIRSYEQVSSHKIPFFSYPPELSATGFSCKERNIPRGIK